ncbi:MAG: hypothetical protein PVH88_16980 [Ignavibacteria bacterium]|jgi:hypothetical protein
MKTTKIYTHVINKGAGIISPLDRQDVTKLTTVTVAKHEAQYKVRQLK